jgi:hypothetical protein
MMQYIWQSILFGSFCDVRNEIGSMSSREVEQSGGWMEIVIGDKSVVLCTNRPYYRYLYLPILLTGFYSALLKVS